jgi:hypothetical protein
MPDLENSLKAGDIVYTRSDKMIAEHPVYMINQDLNKKILKRRFRVSISLDSPYIQIKLTVMIQTVENDS